MSSIPESPSQVKTETTPAIAEVAPGAEIHTNGTNGHYPPDDDVFSEHGDEGLIDPYDQLAWLADHGARFALPFGRSKNEFEKDWTNKPYTLSQAVVHAENGGNVGILTGEQSSNIIAIDRDVKFPETVAMLGDLCQTVKIVRGGAPDRGKLLYRIKGALPPTTAWKEHKDDRHPACECLAKGRHALGPTSEFDGSAYRLIDYEFGIKELTTAEIEHVWRLITGETFDKSQRKGKQTEDKDEFKRKVKDAWPTLKIFEHHGKAVHGVEPERGGETRILGNGGLLVADNGQWYCHSDEVGGDEFDAWAYCTDGRIIDRGDKEQFKRVLSEMAEAGNVARPRGNDKTAEGRDGAAEVETEEPDEPDADEVDDEEATPEPGPLETGATVAGLDLGWVDDYADLMTTLTGAPREFNRLAGLVTAATALQGRARLRMAFGDIYTNIYAVIIARSSVFHKSTAIRKSSAMLRRAQLENLLLANQMTGEGLLKQLVHQPAGIVINDEIGRLFASHNTRYLQDLKPDLTNIYDCDRVSKRLSNEEITVERPYLNILGATTPARFFDGVSFTDWEDGFLARWLFVLPESEPDFDAMTPMLDLQHDLTFNELATKLAAAARQTQIQDFLLAGDAFKIWDTWQRQAAKQAYLYEDDVAAAFVTRYAAYALKFAIILAALNGTWGQITPDEMKTAIQLADYYKSIAHRLMSERQSFGISGGKLQKVFAVVFKKRGATTSNLQQMCNMRKNEIEPCLQKLEEIGAIIAEKKGNGFRFFAAVKELPAKLWK